MRPIRILFFIGSLRTGGKERRLIELLTYLKEKDRFDILVVLAYDFVEYPAFYNLGIEYKVLNKKPSFKDPRVFLSLFRLCMRYKPDIIHTWGGMQTFYMLPSAIFQRIPLINSQITDAPLKLKKWTFINLINSLNYRFSNVILANSYAGLMAYNVNKRTKSKVIYNGLNPKRFINLPNPEETKKKFGIKTPYLVVMTASFTPNKDYDTFYKVADYITKRRSDITFIGIGGYDNDSTIFEKFQTLIKDNAQILMPGKIKDVEALVNISDIGILFSPNGEGISNAVLEYMALGKPVVANDAGGTKELVVNGNNGYLITHESIEDIVKIIIDLINDQERRRILGENGKKIIHDQYTLEKMGSEFETLYKNTMRAKQ